MIDVPEGAFLENGYDLVQVVVKDDDGVLLCEDVSVSADVPADVKKIPPRDVVGSDQQRRGNQWRLVPHDPAKAA